MYYHNIIIIRRKLDTTDAPSAKKSAFRFPAIAISVSDDNNNMFRDTIRV